jgi:hypothetical protein
MGYRGGELTDLVPALDAGVRRFGRRTTEKVGDDLKRRVRRHTPVAKPGAAAIVASYGSSSAWIRARGGRRPGHLKDSWENTPVQERGGVRGLRFVVATLTRDPIAPHVEYPTRPHLIRAKRAGALTIPTIGGMVLRDSVQHPGTQGSYMMAKALQEVAGTWRATAVREWSDEARTMWRVR